MHVSVHHNARVSSKRDAHDLSMKKMNEENEEMHDDPFRVIRTWESRKVS